MMYSVELRRIILPYLDLYCGSCRIRKAIIKHWAQTGDLIQAINKYKNMPNVNTLIMETEILEKYRKLIETSKEGKLPS